MTEVQEEEVEEEEGAECGVRTVRVVGLNEEVGWEGGEGHR